MAVFSWNLCNLSQIYYMLSLCLKFFNFYFFLLFAYCCLFPWWTRLLFKVRLQIYTTCDSRPTEWVSISSIAHDTNNPAGQLKLSEWTFTTACQTSSSEPRSQNLYKSVIVDHISLVYNCSHFSLMQTKHCKFAITKPYSLNIMILEAATTKLQLENTDTHSFVKHPITQT